MADIIHRVGIKAPQAHVFESLTTLKGLSHWWTEETSGSSSLGDTIVFRFRATDGSIKGEMQMKVQKLESNRFVEWSCVQGPPDWIGTRLEFSLKQEGEFTIVLFSHKDWQLASESMAHCSTKWAIFLTSLRDYVENGKGKPSPHDVKIDNWN